MSFVINNKLRIRVPSVKSLHFSTSFQLNSFPVVFLSEVFGWPEMSRASRATHPDEPARYPERFQEPTQPCDYRPATEEFLDSSHSSAPPLHMEQGSRRDRGPRYSNNLDKITSTLLELVARK